jgi:hypothetical protein
MLSLKSRLVKLVVAAVGLTSIYVVLNALRYKDSPETLLRRPVMLVDCVDHLDAPIGNFKIFSSDKGMTATLENGGKTTTLNFLGGDKYGNGSGEELSFDGEINIFNIFGDKSGVCGLS